MINLYNDIIFENLFKKYLNEGLTENKATKAARKAMWRMRHIVTSKEFENLSK